MKNTAWFVSKTGFQPFAFTSVEAAKKSMEITHSELEDKPEILSETEDQVIWSDGTFAHLVEIKERPDHL